MKTKVCPKCKKEQPITEFYKDRTTRDGFCWQCKSCTKEYKSQDEVKKNCRERMRRWRKNNPEKEKEIRKRFREKNPHYHKEYRMKYPIKDWVYATIANHKKRYKVNVKAKELISLANLTTHCSICNKKLDYSHGKKKLNLASPTIDRINNEKVLNKNNIWIVCHQCNTTKGIRKFNEFVKYCEMVVNKFNKKG